MGFPGLCSGPATSPFLSSVISGMRDSAQTSHKSWLLNSHGSVWASFPWLTAWNQTRKEYLNHIISKIKELGLPWPPWDFWEPALSLNRLCCFSTLTWSLNATACLTSSLILQTHHVPKLNSTALPPQVNSCSECQVREVMYQQKKKKKNQNPSSLTLRSETFSLFQHAYLSHGNHNII